LDKRGFQDILMADPMIARSLERELAKRRLELGQEMARDRQKES